MDLTSAKSLTGGEVINRLCSGLSRLGRPLSEKDQDFLAGWDFPVSDEPPDHGTSDALIYICTARATICLRQNLYSYGGLGVSLLSQEPGGSLSRWGRDGFSWNYGNAHLCWEFAAKFFRQRAHQVKETMHTLDKFAARGYANARINYLDPCAPRICDVGSAAGPASIGVRGYFQDKSLDVVPSFQLIDKYDWERAITASGLHLGQVGEVWFREQDLADMTSHDWIELGQNNDLIVGWFMYDFLWHPDLGGTIFRDSVLMNIMEQGCSILLSYPAQRRGTKGWNKCEPPAAWQWHREFSCFFGSCDKYDSQGGRVQWVLLKKRRR